MTTAGKSNIKDVEVDNIDVKYHEVEESDRWRINFIKEVVNVKYGELGVSEFTKEEVDAILNYICTK